MSATPLSKFLNQPPCILTADAVIERLRRRSGLELDLPSELTNLGKFNIA